MRCLFTCLAALLLSFCKAETIDWRAKTEKASYIHRAIKKVTDIIVYDILFAACGKPQFMLILPLQVMKPL